MAVAPMGSSYVMPVGPRGSQEDQALGQNGSLGSLKIFTWNVNGMRGEQRRQNVICRLRHLNADIYLIQETHLTKQELLSCPLSQYKIYCAPCNSKKRCGVATLIKKCIQFSLIAGKRDPEGRYLIVEGSYVGAPLKLVNIYGPNKDDPKFFQDVFLDLENSENIIIAGDFNTVMDPSKDRTTGLKRRSNSRNVIENYMLRNNLIDCWREDNPEVRQYTFRPPQSRIDFFLVNKSFEQNDNTIHDILISDHAPVSVTLQFRHQLRVV
uniref:exodeoxyribonuclease III n=1 Tax=Neogobius melanostomus TaxID=47308 RepID=A0A8C6UD94_9GOBI